MKNEISPTERERKRDIERDNKEREMIKSGMRDTLKHIN